jgi:hypothetical protein
MAAETCNINPPLKSKLNYLGAILILLGGLSDPHVLAVLPAEYAGSITFFGGLLLMVLRTFFTAKTPQDPNMNIP